MHLIGNLESYIIFSSDGFQTLWHLYNSTCNQLYMEIRVFNRIENKENTLDQLPRNMPSLVELFCCILYWRAAWIIFFGTVAPLRLFGVIFFRGLAFSLHIMETIAK